MIKINNKKYYTKCLTECATCGKIINVSGTLKFERQQLIGKKNELLAIADFCNELLLKYFN